MNLVPRPVQPAPDMIQRALHLEQSSLNDLFNYSAMIVGECSPLLSSLIEENDRWHHENSQLGKCNALDMQYIYSIWCGEGACSLFFLFIVLL